MLGASLDAYEERCRGGPEVIKRDAEINALHNQIFHELIEMMTEEPSTATRNARLLFRRQTS